MYVRASHARVLPRTRSCPEIIKMETLAWVVPSEFAQGTIDMYHA
jgi:hypothetical protein